MDVSERTGYRRFLCRASRAEHHFNVSAPGLNKQVFDTFVIVADSGFAEEGGACAPEGRLGMFELVWTNSQ
jgi:hypothetical protein